jgi:hypothetical protein
MAGEKLYDYNTSFQVVRTNPKINGNFKITVDSTAKVWLNSMDVNTVLSDKRYKKFEVTGENPYAVDVYNFFKLGTTPTEVIFEAAQFTTGSRQSATEFGEQYDFFYASGSSTLIDKNYTENFRYFAPLWIKDVIPDFFVVFKLPDPISYPYTTNVSVIESGKKYKLIQSPYSTDIFKVTYGVDLSGNPVEYSAGSYIDGIDNYSSYSVISGTGSVALFDELAFYPDVVNPGDFFTNQVLPNAQTVATFDLRESSTIGKYIRDLTRDPGFNPSPINFGVGNAYTFWNGVNYQTGVLGQKGEILDSYYNSTDSIPMIDFESTVTGGFERNGIICSNLLNLEFLFNDPDTDLYTINRYFGMYVSRNDLGNFKLNGDFFWKYKDLDGNFNLPQPSRNNLGYYFDDVSAYQSSTGGVRLFYEGVTGWIPGSLDINQNDPEKLFYITDKFDNFYSLKRSADSQNIPDYETFGPWIGATAGFGTTGFVGATAGTLVITDQQVNLLDFSGPDDKVGSFSGYLPNDPGSSYTAITFLQEIPADINLTFKIVWPEGSRGNVKERYDLISNGNFSGSQLRWIPGDHYATGNNYYFNGVASSNDGIYSIASSFSASAAEITSVTWYSAPSKNDSVIRLVNPGDLNSRFKVAVYSNWEDFSLLYRGVWDSTSSYDSGVIVEYGNKYWLSNTSIAANIAGNQDPTSNTNWTEYYQVDQSLAGLVKINDVDITQISGLADFKGGTQYSTNRVVFNVDDSEAITKERWIQTKQGYSYINEISKYVDLPVFVNGFASGWGNYETLLVATIEDDNQVIDLGSNSHFNVFKMAELSAGVYTFFDTKELDFDFFSSEYSTTPTAEFFRYFQLLPNQTGTIVEGEKYLVQSGSITYAGTVYNAGKVFIGLFGTSIFVDNVIGSSPSVVCPAKFTKLKYVDLATTYDVPVPYETDLGKFPGFLGIESLLSPGADQKMTPKEFQFISGKLSSEYDYLEENYNTQRSNYSRIVPTVNKWVYTGGTDARGNPYRLNLSPAFSSTNFSPSLEKETPDPNYLTHEWFVLEGVPKQFPPSALATQKGYLPSAVDLDTLRSADPANALYFSDSFTALGTDYTGNYSNSANQTKEFFTPLAFNSTTGFYETLFRGVKVQFKKRSNVPNPSTDLDRYVSNYRGYQGYKFSALLRIVDEDPNAIQSPVTYEVIENSTQQFVLLLCTVVMKDYRASDIGHTGPTGGNPYLDHVLMYSLIDKEKDNLVGLTGATGGSSLYSIGDIKLSVGLDLSVTSSSSVTSLTDPGTIYSIPNPDYDSDLREEINLYYPTGATGLVGPTGDGSFYVTQIASTYPWPVGRSQSFVNFGPIDNPSYIFDLPFSPTSPATIPIGSKSKYDGKPVVQLGGGANYFNFIMKRISVAEITKRFNNLSPYIKYSSYYWNPSTSQTVESSNTLNIGILKPSYISRSNGLYPVPSTTGPATLGVNTTTSYGIVKGGSQYSSDLTRYTGGYEPLSRKLILFKNDKSDYVSGYNSVDLSFRNCTFAPEQNGFGLIRNLCYTKVSKNKGLLDAAANLPQGAVYPLIGITPIAKKDFSIFWSTWDPGYYNLFSNYNSETPVAGTRSMREYPTFFGSKIMQTPQEIGLTTFITLPVSRTIGNPNVDEINAQALASLPLIQNIPMADSGSGIGQLETALIGVDLASLDQSIYPDVEVFYQVLEQSNQLVGVLRVDRMLRRFLLNSGIRDVFQNNIISEFGVGNPDSLEDDIRSYIELNVVPIYTASLFNLYVKKVPNPDTNNGGLRYVIGDLLGKDRYKDGYVYEDGLDLVKQNELIYSFTYDVNPNSNWSLTFTFGINKI